MPMQSRSDQIQAYQFFLQRVISGLVAKESDPAELPFRRLGWAGFGSVMLAALAVAGFGVYGILVGGGATSWRDGDSVIVEKETGTTYIYRDDRLHPMANYASAQLAIGGGGEATRVSARSLAGVPRGPRLGIPGAPESLPEGDSLLTSGWSICTQRVADGRGGWETVSVLGVGRAPAGGGALSDGDAVLVQDAGVDGEELHLVWNGHRFAVVEPTPVLRAFGAGAANALPVTSAWLESLPVGDPLEPPANSGLGESTDAFGEGRAPPDVLTGQVVAAQGQYYLVRSAELVQVTRFQADVVLLSQETGSAYPDGPPQERELGPGELADAAIEPLPEPTATSPPATRPELVRLGPDDSREAALCASFDPGELGAEVLAGARMPDQPDWLDTPRYSDQGVRLADHVLVAGGSAALVQAAGAPETPGGGLHLVSDQGVRYALPGPEVAEALGLDPERTVRVPAGLLARLPAGPALHPAEALLPVDRFVAEIVPVEQP